MYALASSSLDYWWREFVGLIRLTDGKPRRD